MELVYIPQIITRLIRDLLPCHIAAVSQLQYPSEPHVFDRFYKVEKAHTPAPQMGSGLGLSIVKRIIESHGQSITVRSARGRGTQFTFTLERASASKRVSDGGKRNVS